MPRPIQILSGIICSPRGRVHSEATTLRCSMVTHGFRAGQIHRMAAPGLSSRLTNVAVRFSTNGVSLAQQSGRTTASIIQQPRADNAFTLVVDFDDSAPPGSDQYSVTLHGISFSLLPRVSAHVASIKVVWATETNRRYQLQYSLSSTAGWSDLGPPIQGTGTNVVFTDSVFGQPRRFYRVVWID